MSILRSLRIFRTIIVATSHRLCSSVLGIKMTRLTQTVRLPLVVPALTILVISIIHRIHRDPSTVLNLSAIFVILQINA